MSDNIKLTKEEQIAAMMIAGSGENMTEQEVKRQAALKEIAEGVPVDVVKAKYSLTNKEEAAAADMIAGTEKK